MDSRDKKNTDKQFKVSNFTYNGFFGRVEDGYAPYTARFIEWTNDPGIATFRCSDGKDRLIPTFALNGVPIGYLPKQVYADSGISFFGTPCRS